MSSTGAAREAGNYLLSHTREGAVPSAQEGLTSVFGMGTGGTPPLSSPAKVMQGGGGRRRREFREGQVVRAISTGTLYASQRLHVPPINLVVYEGPSGRVGLEGGFPLRCFQRLSLPLMVIRLCRWRDNRNTRGASIPVLSY